MTDLERHIVELLLDNDCVIVPGFGGFMAHNLSASYDEKNNIYLPPSRTIGFNPRLTMNDSLLAQSYVNCYDISYPEALKQIERDVDSLRQKIESEKEYTICGIGRIVMLESGEYDFVPEASGITTPGMYGFEPYEIKMLEREEGSVATGLIENDEEAASDSVFASNSIFAANSKALPTPQKAEAKEEKEERKEIALHIPISVVRHIAAACIIMFVLLSFPSKLGDSSLGNLKQTSIDTSLLYEIMPKDITSGKPESLNDVQQNDSARQGKALQAAGNDENVGNTSMNDGKSKQTCYSVVLASRITRKNAQAYVDNLHRKGMLEASVHTSAGITKVVYKQFGTLDEARKCMHTLEKNSEFADCWVTEIKQ